VRVELSRRFGVNGSDDPWVQNWPHDGSGISRMGKTHHMPNFMRG
jgi:hypothetical protein